eukprot:12897823-Ditylum_brightwellii.AAC.1
MIGGLLNLLAGLVLCLPVLCCAHDKDLAHSSAHDASAAVAIGVTPLLLVIAAVDVAHKFIVALLLVLENDVAEHLI